MAKSNLDSRDLNERLEELQEQRDNKDENDLDEAEYEELKALETLKEECDSYGWDDGIQFIANYEFQDYCRELAEDCYGLPDNNPLANHIDWESWANAVEMDYSEVEYNGTTYLYREA